MFYLTIELNGLISLIGFKIFKESQLFKYSPDRGVILVVQRSDKAESGKPCLKKACSLASKKT